jgi:hypothetical protein
MIGLVHVEALNRPSHHLVLAHIVGVVETRRLKLGIRCSDFG